MFKNYRLQLSLAAFISSFLFTLVGILLLRRGAVAAGLAVIVLGIAAYLWSSSQLQKNAPMQGDFQKIRKYAPVIVFGFLSLASFLAVIYLMSDPQQTGTKEYAADFLWIFSILCLLATVFWHQGVNRISREQINKWWIGHRSEVLIVGLIILAGVLARSFDLPDHPYPWSGDEASVGLEARRILSGEITDFFDTGWSGQPNWSFVPTALSLKVIGDNITGVRAASALTGILAVIFIYLLGRLMFNKQVGLLAAAFLAFYPVHVHFSRVGVNNISDSFTVVLVLWLVLRAVRTGRIGDYALAGVASGLTIYSYVGSRLVLIMAVGTLMYIALVNRDFLRKNLKALAIYLAAAVITAAPMAYFFATHPDIFSTRIGQEGILFNGWLVRHAQETGQSVLSVLADQFSKSTLVFIGNEALGMFYNSPQPYLTIAGSILFLLGMVYAFSRLRHVPNVILLGWFWSVVLLGGVLTLNPPSNTRMVMTGPAVALFVALGLWQLVEVLARINPAARWRTVLMLIVVILLTLENGMFYFGEYRANDYFKDANGELAMEAGLQLGELGRNYSLFLIGHPRVFSDFPTLAFIAPDNEKYDLNPEELDGLLNLAINQGAIFVAIPENMEALAQIEQRFPGGTSQVIPRKTTENEILYYAYIVPPN